MTDETVTTFHHPDCYSAADPKASEIMTVDLGGGAYDWVCKKCGKTVGHMMDFGTLDLGIVDESVLNPANEYVPYS